MDSSHAGHNLTLIDYSRLQPLTLCWPIGGQQLVYVTQKYQLISLGTSTEVLLKKVPGTRYFFCNAKKKQAKARRVEWSWYCWWKRDITELRLTTGTLPDLIILGLTTPAGGNAALVIDCKHHV